MEHNKSSPKREIHSITYLPQKTRKTLNKQSKVTPKITRKRRANYTQSKQKNRNNKN